MLVKEHRRAEKESPTGEKIGSMATTPSVPLKNVVHAFRELYEVSDASARWEHETMMKFTHQIDFRTSTQVLNFACSTYVLTRKKSRWEGRRISQKKKRMTHVGPTGNISETPASQRYDGEMCSRKIRTILRNNSEWTRS
jgi:hypothetical protein